MSTNVAAVPMTRIKCVAEITNATFFAYAAAEEPDSRTRTAWNVWNVDRTLLGQRLKRWPGASGRSRCKASMMCWRGLSSPA